MNSVVKQSRKSTMGHFSAALTMPRMALAGSVLALILSPGPLAFADELRLPIAENARQGNQQELPAKGNSMAAVEARFGEPQRRTEPVGKPPISQWHYPDFVVYFESSHVIHAVLRRQSR